MMPRLATAVLLLSAVVTMLACAGAAPGARSAGPTHGAAGDADEGDAPLDDDPAASTEKALGCDDRCATRIDQAAALLERARAAGDAPNVEVAYRHAGDGFVEAWRGCDLSVRTGEDRGCQGAATVIARMAEAFERAKRDDGAIFAYLAALDPRWRVDGDPTASKAPAELARLAAQAEERARREPKAAGVAEGLVAAAHARLALDEDTAAVDDATQHRRLYARQHRDDVALVAVAIAAHYLERESWQQALAALSPATRPANPKAPYLGVLWHSTRGQALAGLGREAAARQEFSRALKLWRPPGRGNVAAVIGRAKPLPMQGRERVVDAVGAALFFSAEQKRKRASTPAMPGYRGPATVKGVNGYVQKDVAAWASRRNERVLEAHAAYGQISQIPPVPPPRWVVAAAAATGELWAEFAEAFTQAPVPAAVQNDTELSEAWSRATTEASAPLQAKARRAFEVCRKAARRYAIDDARSSRCADWLSAHPAE